MAGVPASLGVAFGCLVRSLILWPDMFGGAPPTFDSAGERLPGTDPVDVVITVGCLLGMVVWLWAVIMFVRQQPRSPITYLLTALIAAPFLWWVREVWRFAYPVCNAL